jgi:hypothetical protein
MHSLELPALRSGLGILDFVQCALNGWQSGRKVLIMLNRVPCCLNVMFFVIILLLESLYIFAI